MNLLMLLNARELVKQLQTELETALLPTRVIVDIPKADFEQLIVGFDGRWGYLSPRPSLGGLDSWELPISSEVIAEQLTDPAFDQREAINAYIAAIAFYVNCHLGLLLNGEFDFCARERLVTGQDNKKARRLLNYMSWAQMKILDTQLTI